MTKPIGFDNFKNFYIIPANGGDAILKKASFFKTISSLHRMFRGASIASTSAAATVVVTTTEAHGLPVGSKVTIDGMPNALAGLNGEWVVLSAPTTTTFTVGFNSTAPGASAGSGIAGVDQGDYYPDTYGITVGDNCVAAYGNAWDGPTVG